MMDRRHVYWYSLDGLVGVSPGDPPTPIDLLRVDLQSGRLEQVVSPGFEAVIVDNIAGQNSQDLYVLTRQGLVAVRKP